MTHAFLLSLGILQIIIQLIAVYYSYRIYLFNRLNKAWLTLTFGLILMALRRITASLVEFDIIPSFTGFISDIDRFILPTLISICLLMGLFYMFKNFENFEIIEKKIKNKISNKRYNGK
jgi:hypothetical protein